LGRQVCFWSQERRGSYNVAGSWFAQRCLFQPGGASSCFETFGDANDDLVVNVNDLLMVITHWGLGPGSC